MSWTNLKAAIATAIKTNNNQEITGEVLQNTLISIVNLVGANATFAGVATPSTNPGTPDGPVFWIAGLAGQYSNFNNIELQNGLSVLMWNGSWNSQQIISIDDKPTAGSDNLVKSGGVANIINIINQSIGKNVIHLDSINTTTTVFTNLSFIQGGRYIIKATFDNTTNHIYIQIKEGDTLIYEQELISGEQYTFTSNKNLNNCSATLVVISGGLSNVDLELQSDINQPVINIVKNLNTSIYTSNASIYAIKELYIWGCDIASNDVFSIPVIHRNNNGTWRIYVQKNDTNYAIYEATTEEKGIIYFGDLRRIFVAIIIDWKCLDNGITRVNWLLTDKVLNLEYSPSIKEFIENRNTFENISENVDRLLLSDFQGSGYWNDNKGITFHGSWHSGVIDISDYIGHTLKFALGYSEHNAAHCYIDINGVYTQLDTLDSYTQLTGCSSFVVPNGASSLYYAYGALTPYITVYKGNLLISYNMTTPYQKVPLAGIFSQVGDTRYFEFINNINKRQRVLFFKYSNNGEIRYSVMELMPFEKITIEITHGSESTLYYIIRLLQIESSEYNITVNIFKNFKETLDDKNECVPFIGSGKKIISRSYESYTHCPRVINTVNNLFVVYQGSSTVSSEARGTSHISLYVCNKVSNRKCYKFVENPILVDEYINQQLVADTYNHSVALKEDLIYIRYSCILGDTNSAMVYKTFNTNSFELSNVAMQKLYYNGTEVDWTWNNYIKMVNSLYGYSFDETLRKRWTLETNGITEYDGAYYCVTAHQCSENAADFHVPYILMRTTDLIKWEPIAVLFDTMPSGETELAIVDDKILCLFRSQTFGTYYCVYGIDGTQIKGVTKISKIDSKPFVFVYNEELYGMYNIPTQGVDVDDPQQWNAFYSLYFGRVKVAIAKLDSDNDLNIIQSYYSPDGWCYYTASVLKNQIYVVNNEDISGFRKNITAGPNGDITIQQLIIE